MSESKRKKITLGRTHLPQGAIPLIVETIKKGRLSYGPLTREFEEKFAQLHERKQAVFTTSGTDALRFALLALKEREGWRDGDEVIVPAVTFVATANIVLQSGLTPVFADVDAQTYNIDPQEVARRITPKTRAIIPVHLFGLPADMQSLTEIAQEHNLKVIEDSAQAVAVKYREKPVGSWGDLACFSTYMAHLLVTGVGGLVLTDDSEEETLIRSIMNHGRSPEYLNIDADNKVDSDNFPKVVKNRFTFLRLGYSSRLTEMEAAFGLAGLGHIQEEILSRQKNGAYLLKGLADLEGRLQLPHTPSDREHAFMFFTVLLKGKDIDRDELVLHLERRGIETRYAMPLVNQPVYKNIFGDIEAEYPVARLLNEQAFCIGCHPGLTRSDLDYVISEFYNFLNQK